MWEACALCALPVPISMTGIVKTIVRIKSRGNFYVIKHVLAMVEAESSAVLNS